MSTLSPRALALRNRCAGLALRPEDWEVVAQAVEGMIPAWQPIETAPRDGVPIFLHYDWEPLTVIAYWGSGTEDGWDGDPKPDDGSPQWRVRWDESRLAPGYDDPTHWMQLPAPPAAAENTEEPRA